MGAPGANAEPSHLLLGPMALAYVFPSLCPQEATQPGSQCSPPGSAELQSHLWQAWLHPCHPIMLALTRGAAGKQVASSPLQWTPQES